MVGYMSVWFNNTETHILEYDDRTQEKTYDFKYCLVERLLNKYENVGYEFNLDYFTKKERYVHYKKILQEKYNVKVYHNDTFDKRKRNENNYDYIKRVL